METLNLVYITCKNTAQAEIIGRSLVQERLAACVNIIPNMRSIYWWQGTMEESNEVIIIAKTQQKLLARLTQRVNELHTYSVPCVVSVPILGGNVNYLTWLIAETSTPSE